MNIHENKRWGECSKEKIDEAVVKSVPYNTSRNQKSIWKQFMQFCNSRKYKIEQSTSIEMLATFLKDYAFNMRKSNGEEYKETVVKTIWNTVAKLLQQKFYDEFQIKFDPFNDVEFKQARSAKDSKRKELKLIPSKRKMATCWVPDCKHCSEQGMCGKFFKFPKDKALLKKWLILVKRSNATPTVHSVICSCHFVDGNKDNLPTIFPVRLEQAERSTHVNKEQQNLQDTSVSKAIYCRLCLNPVTKEELICLGDYHNINYPSGTIQYKRNKILQTEKHLKMIRMLMPNFDHDLVYNPVMCTACRIRLQMSSDFVEQCMATQKLIQQFKDEHRPSEKMVNCEDVVLLSSSQLDVPSKKRKIVEPSSSKSVEQPNETRAVPPDQEFINPELVIKMEDIEEIDEKFEVTPEEICYIKQEIVEAETEDEIRTNLEIKIEPELPLLSAVKVEPCSIATSDFTVKTDPDSVKQFNTDDLSCDVTKSSSLVHTVDLPSQLSPTVPVLNCSNLQVLVPEIFSDISSVNSQFQNYQNR